MAGNPYAVPSSCPPCPPCPGADPDFTYSGGAQVRPTPDDGVRYQGGATLIPVGPSWGYAPVGPPAAPGTSIYGGQVGVRSRGPGASVTPGTTLRTPTPATHRAQAGGQRSVALRVPYSGLGFDVVPSADLRNLALAGTFMLAAFAGVFVWTVFEKE